MNDYNNPFDEIERLKRACQRIENRLREIYIALTVWSVIGGMLIVKYVFGYPFIWEGW
jgi:hypothetical protein